MIISLRGTNGAGKSHVVRLIMDQYYRRTEVRYPGRKKPTGYVCQRDEKNLFVPGHYEIANGGVDTLPDLDTAYDLIRTHALELGMDVLYEGKNLSDGPKRLLDMHEQGIEVMAVLLEEPVQVCVRSVRARGHKIKVETIEKLHAKCRKDIEKMKKAGVPIFVGNRIAVFRHLRGVLL